MSQIISRPAGIQVPKVKKERGTKTNILPVPVRVESFIPSPPLRGHNGRKFGAPNRITPVVEVLNQNPGVWYKVAIGLYSSVGQIRLRMQAQDNTLHFEHREGSGGNWELFAMAPDLSGQHTH